MQKKEIHRRQTTTKKNIHQRMKRTNERVLKRQARSTNFVVETFLLHQLYSLFGHRSFNVDKEVERRNENLMKHKIC